jgi:hypothetical protein
MRTLRVSKIRFMMKQQWICAARSSSSKYYNTSLEYHHIRTDDFISRDTNLIDVWRCSIFRGRSCPTKHMRVFCRLRALVNPCPPTHHFPPENNSEGQSQIQTYTIATLSRGSCSGSRLCSGSADSPPAPRVKPDRDPRFRI